jgi:hypothetical protein
MKDQHFLVKGVDDSVYPFVAKLQNARKSITELLGQLIPTRTI